MTSVKLMKAVQLNATGLKPLRTSVTREFAARWSRAIFIIVVGFVACEIYDGGIQKTTSRHKALLFHPDQYVETIFCRR